jgi:hypothetical protein
MCSLRQLNCVVRLVNEISKDGSRNVQGAGQFEEIRNIEMVTLPLLA